jgi:hypothetical protein
LHALITMRLSQTGLVNWREIFKPWWRHNLRWAQNLFLSKQVLLLIHTEIMMRRLLSYALRFIRQYLSMI